MKIYNTLTRKKEEFVPLDPNEIKMYVCGPTVYNYIHIGNARPFVVFDTMRKYLEYRGEHVKFVQNFTDVDDKIINRAREEGITPEEVGDKYIKAYFEDVKELNVTPATVHPRVTETIPEIIEFVQGLIDKGLAYEIDGDVYYSARKFPGYGKLSKQNIEELESGSRVNVDEQKKILWTLLFGKSRKPKTKWHGILLGEKGALAGISNALQWRKSTLEKQSIYIPEDRTYSFLITKTKSRSRKDFRVRPLRITGCTMAILLSTTKKCQNLWVTFLPSEIF